jgi:hypothetical protein
MRNFMKLVIALMALSCLSGIGMAGCGDKPVVTPPVVTPPVVTPPVTTNTNIETTTTIAQAAGSPNDGSVNAAANGNLNIDAENHEADVNAPNGQAVGIVDSPGAKVEIEETDVSGTGNTVAEDGSSITQVEVEIKDSFNTETEANAEDGSQAAITGDDSTLVQIQDVDVNSHNTEIYRTSIDHSVEITNIDNSQKTVEITEIDNSVKQVITGDVNIGDVKNINIDGVQVPVTVIGVNTNGDIIVTVNVHVDNQPKEIQYVVKHETTVVSGGSVGFVTGPVGKPHKMAGQGELVITEIAENVDCSKTVELKAVGGNVKIVGGKLIMSDGANTVSVAIANPVVIKEGTYVTVDIQFSGKVGTASVRSENGVNADATFNLTAVPVGMSLQRYPENSAMFPFVVAFATLGAPNNPAAPAMG